MTYSIFGVLVAAALREHGVRPAAVVSAVVITTVVAVPGATFVHELAHAFTSVALTGQRVTIEIGRQPAAVRFAIGRVDVFWDPRRGRAACCFLPERISRPRIVAIAMAGPAASALVAIGFLAIVANEPKYSFGWVLAGFCVLHCAISVVVDTMPMQGLPAWWFGSSLHDGANDGMLAWRALRGFRGHAIWDPQGQPADRASKPPVVVSERTRHVLVHAHGEAVALGHRHVGTEHAVAALIHADDSSASLLAAHGGRSSTPCAIPACPPNDSAALPITPRLTRVLDMARAALTLSGSTRIEPEHLILAFLHDPECSAEGLLGVGIDTRQLRADLVSRLATPRWDGKA